jgi:hypothetical protein
MADDDITPSNPLVAHVQQEELEEARSIWMFLNGRAKKNRPGEWCALKSLVRCGIVDCLLTHVL